MISQLSIVTWVTIVLMLIGMFFLLKSFSLPGSFYKNQKDREWLLKRKIRIKERDKEIIEEIEDLGRDEVMEEVEEV